MATPESLARQLQSAALREVDPALARFERELRRILPGLHADAASAAREARQLAEIPAGVNEDDATRLAREGRAKMAQFAARRSASIAAQAEAEIGRLTNTLTAELEAAVTRAMAAGAEAAAALANTALPAGLTLEQLAERGLTWQRLPVEALREAVAAQAPGAPLRSLVDQLGADASRRLRTQLLAGLAAGRAPRAVGDIIAKELGLTKVRGETIARTEILRSYRSASLASYARNVDVVPRFRRLATLSSRSCPACLGLDGKEQKTAELFATHPNCRCAVVPIPLTFRELGIDIDEPVRPVRESGADWLAGQDAGVQRDILGVGGLKAYQAGTPLARFARVEVDKTWGPTVRTASLSELGHRQTGTEAAGG